MGIIVEYAERAFRIADFGLNRKANRRKQHIVPPLSYLMAIIYDALIFQPAIVYIVNYAFMTFGIINSCSYLQCCQNIAVQIFVCKKSVVGFGSGFVRPVFRFQSDISAEIFYWVRNIMGANGLGIAPRSWNPNTQETTRALNFALRSLCHTRDLSISINTFNFCRVRTQQKLNWQPCLAFYYFLVGK